MFFKMFLKRFAPQSLYGRFLLIIIVPAVLVQLVATYMFYARHWESITRNISASLASEIAMVLDKARAAAPEKRLEIINDAEKYLNFKVSFQDNEVPEALAGKPTKRFPELEQEIKEYFKFPFYLVDKAEASEIIVVMNTKEEQITVTVPRKRLMNPTTYIYIMWIVGTGFILLVVSILFLKNQVRSIIRLSEAADKFGKGQEVTNFKPQGALEIRQAAKAFIEMKDRLRRQIRQRTEMLAGVSHDLRTPLTRMKLQLAMMEKSPQVKELEQDVQEMEHMVEGYLEFVRGGEAEKTEAVHLTPYIKNIVQGYKSEKRRLTLSLKEDAMLPVRPHAFRRALTNLLENALRYGKKVKISTALVDDHVDIVIEDDGPGIPEEKRDTVFLPFVRLETSRNSETGGVGLGLSIARDVVHNHGGHITLSTSDMGGLKVTISLPL